MSKTKVTTEEGMQVLLENLKPGEQKTPGELIKLLQSHIEGISSTQCYGIIYRSWTNADAVLQKKGKMYLLIDQFSKQRDGIIEVRQKIRKVKQEIEEIPVSRFTSMENFEKLQNSLQSLEKIKERL
ncbi:MAG TPA: hypothetical protein VK102_08820 [Sphingobacterium sp.]|nr:hypothetical protein [Sphingobacterium sp.]